MWFAAGLFSIACMPKGPVPLAAVEAGELVHGSLGYTPTAILTSEPGRSIDLAIELTLTNTGTSPVRVDISRSRLSIDGVAYGACRYGQGADPGDLVANLAPDATGRVAVTCKDIPRPGQHVAFRFTTAGTGAAGEITVGFVGLGERL